MKPLRPYLYNAYYNWLLDNDLTPYLLVNANYPNTDVPLEFVNDGKIILNLTPRSIGQYSVNDEGILFSARFQGMVRDIFVPFGAAVALYSQENNEGVMFQEEEYYLESAYLSRQEQRVTNDDRTLESEKKAISSTKKKVSHLKLVK